MDANVREESAVRPGGVGAGSSGDAEVDMLAQESPARPQATFEGAIDALRLTGASVGVRKLVELIAQHGAEEGALLAAYESLAGDSPDSGVRYLVNLILEDEHRHHRLLAELGYAMAWGIGEPPVDAVPRRPRSVTGPLLEQTRRLRQAEEEDYRALTDIKRRLRPFADTTLWSLVIDLMLLDTKKHATILRFLERCGNVR